MYFDFGLVKRTHVSTHSPSRYVIFSIYLDIQLQLCLLNSSGFEIYRAIKRIRVLITILHSGQLLRSFSGKFSSKIQCSMYTTFQKSNSHTKCSSAIVILFKLTNFHKKNFNISSIHHQCTLGIPLCLLFSWMFIKENPFIVLKLFVYIDFLLYIRGEILFYVITNHNAHYTKFVPKSHIPLNLSLLICEFINGKVMNIKIKHSIHGTNGIFQLDCEFTKRLLLTLVQIRQQNLTQQNFCRNNKNRKCTKNRRI